MSHQAEKGWTDGNDILSLFAVHEGEQPVSGANSLGGGSGGDIYYQQDDGGNSDDNSYTINIGPVEIDLGEIVTKTIEFVIQKTVEGISAVIDTFNQYMIGLPAPGDPTEVTTWTSPGNPWPAVYGVYGIMTAIAIALLTPSFMIATDTVDPQQRRARLVELGKASMFIIFGVPVVAFSLHFGNELAQTVAPSGYEFVSSTEGIADLGLGLLLGAVLIWAKFSIVGVGILMSLTIYMSVYIMVAFWPLFWALRVQPQRDLQSYGLVGISFLPLVILLRFSQSGILRLLNLLPYDSLGGVAFNMIAIAAGLLVALLGLPYIFLTKLIPRSIILTGRQSLANSKGGSSSGSRRSFGWGGGGGGPDGGGDDDDPPGPPGGGAPKAPTPGVTSESPDDHASSSATDVERTLGLSRSSPRTSKQDSPEDHIPNSSNKADEKDTEETKDRQIGASSDGPSR